MALDKIGMYTSGVRVLKENIVGDVLGPWRPIASAGLSRAIACGVDGTILMTLRATGADATSAADTTNGSGITSILGALAEIRDANFQEMDFQYLASGTTTGYVRCYEDPNVVYELLEDGTISATGAGTGSVALAEGSLTPSTFSTSKITNNPEPTINDLLDSSTRNATLGYNALNLIKASPDASNDGGAGGNFVYQFKIASGFKYAG